MSQIEDVLTDDELREVDDAIDEAERLVPEIDQAIEEGEQSPRAVEIKSKSNGYFGGMDPSEVGRKSAEVRRQKALERLRDNILGKKVAQIKIRNAPPRGEMRGVAAAVVFDMALKILSGEIPVRSASDASKIADSFFNILRLESGQSTHNVETMTGEEKLELIRTMRGEILEQKQQYEKQAAELPVIDQ